MVPGRPTYVCLCSHTIWGVISNNLPTATATPFACVSNVYVEHIL